MTATQLGLEALGRLRVYFAHRSVGDNILDGVRALAAREGVSLRIEEARGRAGVAPGTLLHAPVGDNGDPAGKIADFVRSVDGLGDVDVALVKLCYADFHAGTEPDALFARYHASLRDLRHRHPAVTFVHVTVPLTATQRGWRSVARQLLGRETSGAMNARREAYSDRVRHAYGGSEPVFDLARLESMRPDGTREAWRWHGRTVPAMAAAYSDDGGHLNRAGMEKAARALLELLATLSPTSAPSRRDAP